MIVIGLTGSIASGKSTVAKLFAEAGVPVHSADEAVHRLYEGPLAAEIGAAFPGTVRDGKVDRAALAAALGPDRAALARLESIVHPKVWEAALAFLKAREAEGKKIALLEVPLLFETRNDYPIDRIVVTIAPDAELRRRALERPGMTEARLEALLARQMPQDEKASRADFVIDTGQPLEAVRKRVGEIIAACLAAPGR